MNYFIFDGESSLDYGVYIGGQNTFNAPQRDVAKVAIPGRNGDLVQDNGRFLNVQVPYNIVVMDSFRDKTDAIKAWLLSKKGYCKLIDTYHPDTYRMAMVSGGINFETAAYNLTGRTQVIFDCKPERFLNSGDSVQKIGVWGETETKSGDVATFDGFEYMAFRNIKADIVCGQYLNGYERPWPAGGGPQGAPESNICPIVGYNGITVYRAGKNLLPRPYTDGTAKEANGITWSVNADGSVTANGKATANTVFQLTPNSTGALKFLRAGAYIINGAPTGASASTYCIQCRINGDWTEVYASGKTVNYNPVAGGVDTCRLRITSGTEVDNLVFKPMIRLASVTDSAYEQYDGDKKTLSWQSDAGTVYGGDIDYLNGDLTVTHASVDLGTLTWRKLDGSYPGLYYTDSLRSAIGATDGSVIHGLCSAYLMVPNDGNNGNYGTATEQPDFTMRFKSSDGRIYVTNSLITDIETFEASISGVQLVYELTTAQSYELTGGENVSIGVGKNNVWANTGAVEVEYSLNPNIVDNPTRFDSKPKIRVYGRGNGTLTIDNDTILVNNINEYVDIDSELMNCYKETVNKNADVALPNHEYPVLQPGGTYIDFSGGITAVEVQGRWWTI